MDFKNYEDNKQLNNGTMITTPSDIMTGIMGIIFLFIVVIRIIGAIYNKFIEEEQHTLPTSTVNMRTRSNEILGENYEEIEYHINHNENDTSWDVCPICLEMFTHGKRVIQLDCKHYYHKECIMSWYQKKKICPLCNI